MNIMTVIKAFPQKQFFFYLTIKKKKKEIIKMINLYFNYHS